MEQESKIRFPFAQGSTCACAVIAVSVASAVLRNPAALQPPLLANELLFRRSLERGIKYYDAALRRRKRETPEDRSVYFSARAVVSRERTRHAKKGDVWFADRDVYGYVGHRAFVDSGKETGIMPRLVDEIASVYDRATTGQQVAQAMILTCQNSTYCFIIRRDGMWMYDSHGSNESTLYYFRTLEALATRALSMCGVSGAVEVEENLLQMRNPTLRQPDVVFDPTRRDLNEFEGIRGLNERILLVDEAQFAPESLILQAIIPILMMNETVAIFITTPDDPDSMFMRTVTCTDETGKNRMPVIWLGQPCEECAKNERLVCPHVWYEAPSHKAPWRAERLKWIYANHKDIDARENHARAPALLAPSFPSHLVDALFEAKRRRTSTGPDVWFLSCDPACEGQSEFALCGGYYDSYGFTVNFLDGARFHPQTSIVSQRARLREAISKIRSKPGWDSIPVVFIPENGPPGAPAKLWDDIRDMQPIICMAEAGAAKNSVHSFGVPKTQKSTISMRDRTLLQIANGSLGLSEDLFSLQHVERGCSAADTVSKLRNQMLSYRHQIKKEYGKPHNDDLLIAFMQVLEWSDVFMKQGAGMSSAMYEQFIGKYIAPRRRNR